MVSQPGKLGGVADKMITKFMTSSFKKAGKVINFH
jgi:hypothetical protein